MTTPFELIRSKSCQNPKCSTYFPPFWDTSGAAGYFVAETQNYSAITRRPCSPGPGLQEHVCYVAIRGREGHEHIGFTQPTYFFGGKRSGGVMPVWHITPTDRKNMLAVENQYVRDLGRFKCGQKAHRRVAPDQGYWGVMLWRSSFVFPLRNSRRRPKCPKTGGNMLNILGFGKISI